jgi:hypothetical protein
MSITVLITDKNHIAKIKIEDRLQHRTIDRIEIKVLGKKTPLV